MARLGSRIDSRLALALALVMLGGCDRKPPSTPRDQAEGLYLRGQSEFLAGDFEKALATFAEVRKLTPDDPRLPAAEGEVYFAHGQLQDALARFEEAVKRNPQRATNWSRLGAIQLALGKAKDAETSLGKALERNPKDFNALEDLATLQLKQKNADAAIDSFTRAAQLAPAYKQSELYLDAANLLEETGRDGDALTLLQKATGAGVKDGALTTEIGDLLVKQGKLTEAAQAYRSAAEQSPKNPGPWEMVGRIDVRLGKLDQAIQAFTSSLAVRNRGSIHLELAKLYLGQDEREKARAELDAALGTASADGGRNDLGDSVESSLDLAELLSTFDRRADALTLLRALAAEPGQEKDSQLQLRTARAAADAKDAATLKVACDRFHAQRPRDPCP